MSRPREKNTRIHNWLIRSLPINQARKRWSAAPWRRTANRSGTYRPVSGSVWPLSSRSDEQSPRSCAAYTSAEFFLWTAFFIIAVERWLWMCGCAVIIFLMAIFWMFIMYGNKNYDFFSVRDWMLLQCVLDFPVWIWIVVYNIIIIIVDSQWGLMN